MSKIFGGDAMKFTPPAKVEAPAPAVSDAAAPVADVQSGGEADSAESLRRKYRPSRSGVGSTGTGLSV